MGTTMESGKPFWLAASPNEGSVDYFGFRFYRQPNRNLLVRGAAANSFTNAKTLIYFAAVAYAFRIEHNIDLEEDLNEDQYAAWNNFYKPANYLYIVNYNSKYGEVPDSGFTGANEEGLNYFNSFYTDTSGTYNIKSAFPRMYPPQRSWGYLQQFWQAPLLYFRCIISNAHCILGEYAEDCYKLLSQYHSWKTFIAILKSGKINRSELDIIQEVIDCHVLSHDEQHLAQKIIFDKDNVTEGENDNYKTNYQLIKELKDNGFEGLFPKTKEDYVFLFSYAHLNSLNIGENDVPWKILLSSLSFEIGINRLFTLIAEISTNGAIAADVIRKEINIKTNEWIIKNDFSNRLDDLSQKWLHKYAGSILDHKEIFEQMLDHSHTENFIDGLLQGYIISRIGFSDDVTMSDAYFRLTDSYHYFTPQAFFENKPIPRDMDFIAFIQKLVFWIIDEQFDFSLDRLSMGQKAKFILRKSEFGNEYIFQVERNKFQENRGIIDMIGSTIKLWQSAGVF